METTLIINTYAMKGANMSKLNILWTTDSEETITTLLLPYATNSLKNDWWDEVNIIIWGGSTKLISKSEKIQNFITIMMENGVTIEACKYCADEYNCTEILNNLGVTVKYMGDPFTGYIKDDSHLITI